MPCPTIVRPPQTVKGEEHTQPLLAHTSFCGQAFPQLPQLVESDVVSVQKPAQSVSPVGHTSVVVVVEIMVVVVVLDVPQTFGVPPPPHVAGSVHVPQSRVRPAQSPLEIVPQFAPAAWHVVGAQHMPDTPVILTQLPLQQLALFRHDWPSGLQGSAAAKRGTVASRTVRRANRTTGTRVMCEVSFVAQRPAHNGPDGVKRAALLAPSGQLGIRSQGPQS